MATCNTEEINQQTIAEEYAQGIDTGVCTTSTDITINTDKMNTIIDSVMHKTVIKSDSVFNQAKKAMDVYINDENLDVDDSQKISLYAEFLSDLTKGIVTQATSIAADIVNKEAVLNEEKRLTDAKLATMKHQEREAYFTALEKNYHYRNILPQQYTLAKNEAAASAYKDDEIQANIQNIKTRTEVAHSQMEELAQGLALKDIESIKKYGYQTKRGVLNGTTYYTPQKVNVDNITDEQIKTEQKKNGDNGLLSAQINQANLQASYYHTYGAHKAGDQLMQLINMQINNDWDPDAGIISDFVKVVQYGMNSSLTATPPVLGTTKIGAPQA